MNIKSLQGRALLFPFFLSFLLFASCTKQDPIIHIQGNTMGTYYSVKYVADFPSLSKEQTKAEIEKVLAEVNQQMSTYIKDSEISKFNALKANQEFSISDDFAFVLKFSTELAKKTDGAFDPSIGPLVNLWGFGPNKSRKKPSDKMIQEKLKLVGIDKLSLDKNKLLKKVDGLYIDLSATAKGFAVDKISSLLKAQQYANHMVDIGGEIIASGKKPDGYWKVGIETPSADKAGIQKLVVLQNKAIATSGSYRNFFTEDGVNYNHTIDPKTGKSTQDSLVSVSVVSDSCMKSDGYSTALMAMGFEKAKAFVEKEKLKALLITYDKEKDSFTKHDYLP
jgi:thiamine biosynthesis lipoprotein